MNKRMHQVVEWIVENLKYFQCTGNDNKRFEYFENDFVYECI